jgi:hypothetical protein
MNKHIIKHSTYWRVKYKKELNKHNELMKKCGFKPSIL